VRDPDNQRILAGTRHPSDQGFFFESQPVLATPSAPAAEPAAQQQPEASRQNQPGGSLLANTTIAAIATSARLTKADATALARVAHDALALAIRPVHTPFDGDTIFVLGMGRSDGQNAAAPLGSVELSMLGAAAVHTLARAIVKAIQHAESLHGLPAARDLGAAR
jgi:L-aminopeptidase/D-esterase-like protein